MKIVRSKFAPLAAAGCAAALLTVSPTPAHSAPGGPPLILVNGKRVDLQDANPITQNGRLLVPMRAIFEALDADVTWNQTLNTVIAKRGDQTLTLRPGLTGAQLNGTLVEVSPPAQLVDGRVYVPLRFVSRVLGGDVSWDQARNMVLIQAPPPQDAEPPAPLPDPGVQNPPVQPNPVTPDTPPVAPPAQPLPNQVPPVQTPPVQQPPVQAPPLQNPALPYPPGQQPPMVNPPVQNLPPLLDPGEPLAPLPDEPIPVQPLPVVPVPVPVYPPIIVVPGNPVPDDPRPWPPPRPDRDELSIDDIDIEGPANLGLGSTLTFEVRGTPNCRVTAYIAPGIGVLPLREERNRDGVYSGTYLVGRGDNGRLVRPSIQLERNGRKVERRSNRTISIDTVAPRLVSSTINQGDQLEQLPDKVRLRYEDADTDSVARADAVLTTSRGREVLNAQVDNNTVDVRFNPKTNSDGILSLEVRTFDRAGNQATDRIDFRVRTASTNPGPFPPRPQPNPQLDLEVLGTDTAPGGWYREGQQIVVRAKATSGSKLRFMLADPDHGGDMVETPANSGRFEGRYTVKGNDSVVKPALRVVAERNGSQAQKDLLLQIGVDAVAPVVTSIDPTPGTVFNQPIREFNLQVDDGNGSGLKELQAVLVVNGSPIQLIPEFNGNRVRLGIGPRVRDGLTGVVELRIGLLDNAGNVRKQRYSYTFNTATAPAQQTVRILSPRGTPGPAPFAISGQSSPGAQVLVTMTVAGPQVNPRTATATWTVTADAQGSWQTPLATVPDRIRTPNNSMTIMATLGNGQTDQVTVRLK